MSHLLKISDITKAYPKAIKLLVIVIVFQIFLPIILEQYFQFIEKSLIKSNASSNYQIFDFNDHQSKFKEYIPHQYVFCVVDKTNLPTINERYWTKDGNYTEIISRNGKWKSTAYSDRSSEILFIFFSVGGCLCMLGYFLYLIRILKKNKWAYLFITPEFNNREGVFILCGISLVLTVFFIGILHAIM